MDDDMNQRVARIRAVDDEAARKRSRAASEARARALEQEEIENDRAAEIVELAVDFALWCGRHGIPFDNKPRKAGPLWATGTLRLKDSLGVTPRRVPRTWNMARYGGESDSDGKGTARIDLHVSKRGDLFIDSFQIHDWRQCFSVDMVRNSIAARVARSGYQWD